MGWAFGTHHASLHLTRKLFNGLPEDSACLSRFCAAVSFGTSITEACISCGAGMAGAASLFASCCCCRTGMAGLLAPCCCAGWNLVIVNTLLRRCCWDLGCCTCAVHRDVLVACKGNMLV